MPRKQGSDQEERNAQAISSKLTDAKEIAERSGDGTLVFLIEMALLEVNERRKQ